MYKVITIDDEPLVKKTLRVLIESYPDDWFQVIDEAEDGRDGLERIERHSPDLVITDLNMPIMNGLELIERLRASGRTVDVAVLSGYDDFDYARQALLHGVVDYVLKPVRPEAIRQLLDRVRARRTADAAASNGRGEWIAFCGETAKIVAERVWLLDDAGAEEQLERYAARVEARGTDRENTAEAYQALVTLVSSELRQRGAGTLGPPLAVEADGGESGAARTRSEASRLREETNALLRAKIEALGRERQVGNHQGIRAAVAYLEAQFHNSELSLPLAADAAGMSQGHFSRTFKREMGVSFIEYVTRLRIERAKALLDVPGMKTWEIAEAIGYQEYAHFAKVFRKYTGLTPSEFRKREGGARAMDERGYEE
ncbi:response regulator transcription factor [Paenibacillus antri]|uniref:response regulator transcription factor n=1 Tax=Paenibacillus antri TaxID=2582848 RepID=UPI0013053504|nr:response regulator [Paenibacillus antri]